MPFEGKALRCDGRELLCQPNYVLLARYRVRVTLYSTKQALNGACQTLFFDVSNIMVDKCLFKILAFKTDGFKLKPSLPSRYDKQLNIEELAAGRGLGEVGSV